MRTHYQTKNRLRNHEPIQCRPIWGEQLALSWFYSTSSEPQVRHSVWFTQQWLTQVVIGKVGSGTPAFQIKSAACGKCKIIVWFDQFFQLVGSLGVDYGKHLLTTNWLDESTPVPYPSSRGILVFLPIPFQGIPDFNFFGVRVASLETVFWHPRAGWTPDQTPGPSNA